MTEARKEFSAFVLLPMLLLLLGQMVSLTLGNIEDNYGKNDSNDNTTRIFIVNDNANGTNESSVSSLNIRYENFSMSPETTTSSSSSSSSSLTTMSSTTTTTTTNPMILLETKKILENELEHVLESAISAGQVIMTKTSGYNGKNMTTEIFIPLTMIENDEKSIGSKTSIDNDRTIDNNHTIDNDQTIAQSVNRERSSSPPQDYAMMNDDIENIDDLLAVAEYEPQKIGANVIQIIAGPQNLPVKTLNKRPNDQTYYEVSRKRDLTRNTPKIVNYPLNRQSTDTTIAASSKPLKITDFSNSSISKNVQRTKSRLPLREYNNRDTRHDSSLSSKLREKVMNDNYGVDWSREPRHLKPYSISGIIEKTTVVPIFPDTTELPVKSSPTIHSNHEIKNLRNLPVTLRPSLPTKFQSIRPNYELPLKRQTLQRSPIQKFVTSKIPDTTASRRNDDVTSKNEAKTAEKFTADRQLNYIKRYNLSSPVEPTITQSTHRSYRPIVAAPYEEKIAEKYSKNVAKNDADYSDDDSSIDDEQKSDQSGTIGSSTYIDSKKFIPTAETLRIHDKRRNELKHSRNDVSAGILTKPIYETPNNNVTDIVPNFTSQRRSFDVLSEQQLSRAKNPHSVVSNVPIYQPYGYQRTLPVRPITPLFRSKPRISSYHSEQTVPTIISTENSPENVAERVSETLPKKLAKPRESYSYENSEESDENPRQINDRINVGNYDDERYDKSENAGQIDNTNYSDSQENVNVYTPPVENPRISTPLPRDHRGNPQRGAWKSHDRIIATDVPLRSFDNPINENQRPNDEMNHSSPILTKQQASRASKSANGRNKLPINFANEATQYDSSELPNETVFVENTRHTLNQPNSGNYGSKVGAPLVVENYENSLNPRRSRGNRMRPVNLRNQKITNGNERLRVEPAESVQRDDVIEDAKVDYQDEEQPEESSVHEENHENLENHEEAKKDVAVDEKSEMGGGEAHKEDHHEEGKKKAEKGYKEWHEHDKGEKGHVDKEKHENEYDEKEGDEKKHEEASGYHKEHHHDEKGAKEAEFAEKGEHQKGHSTKGQHVVHKNNEYEKKTEFYDESHEEDGNEKEGEYHHEHESKKGGHEKSGHHDSAYDVKKNGEKGEHEKGGHWDEDKGHDDKKGRESSHRHGEKYGKKGGHEEGLKWSHKKGDNGKQR